MAAIWSVRFNGQAHSFDEFPPGLFQRVASRHGLGWFPLFYQPAENTDAFLDLLGEMANHVGAEPPTANTMAEFRALMRALEPGLIEDDEEEIPVLQTPTEPEVPEEDVPEEEEGSEDEEVPDEEAVAVVEMPMTVKGLDRLYRSLDAYEKGESRASSFASFSAANVYAGAATVAVAAAVGPDRQLSSINKNADNPATLKVITKRQRVGRGTGPGWVAKAVPGGQWAMVEWGTKPHLIGIGGKRRRPTRRQARLLEAGTALSGVFGDRPLLAFGGRVVRGPIQHPGTKGKHPFWRSVRAVEGRAKTTWSNTYMAQSIRLLTVGR